MSSVRPLRNTFLRRFRLSLGSRLARLILASNLAGLIILIVGAMVLNEMRSGLVTARIGGLQTQAQVISSLLADDATIGAPIPDIDIEAARATLRKLDLPRSVRAQVRLTDQSLVADSLFVSERVSESALDPIEEESGFQAFSRGLANWLDNSLSRSSPRDANGIVPAETYEEEFGRARNGERAASQRLSDRGERILSVSIPIQRVSAVVGILTLEASDVDEIVRAERAALVPFIGVAVLVALITSLLLTWGIARPLRRLAYAADLVRRGQAQHVDLPKIAGRRDEIGDLARSVSDMTDALFERLSANAQFAADVAHELKNPLTSIRSAVETAELVDHDEDARSRLREVIAKDVQRLDRLISDISNASRLEADVGRMPEVRLDIGKLLSDIIDTYNATASEVEIGLEFRDETLGAGLLVKGRAGPLGQVFRNLIDNARSFSPEGGTVKVILEQSHDGPKTLARIQILDEGPGIPEDKLTKIFQRFYTDRPKGAAFGNNSGLGLSIVKQIIEAHRGTVEASNQPSSGACFTVDLPAE
ncbi:MAG: ATP-binding protein [Pseudomonadota bacterium]